MQRTFEQVLAVLPARSRDGFVALARQAHSAGKANMARAPHFAKLREFLLSTLTNARYAVPTDQELEQMIDRYFGVSSR